MKDAENSELALLSVAASKAAAETEHELIVRIQSEDDLPHLKGLSPERVAWVEVPLGLADREELDEFSVDVLLSDPKAQASHLYRLAGVRDPNLPRLSIPTADGFGDAVAVGMALHFPIRLIPVQPNSSEVAELEKVLDRYLRDANASQPVEPFHSALSTLLHGDARTLWEAVEKEPLYYRSEPPEPGLENPDAVSVRLDSLVAEGAECASCSLQPWCAGWFKWPDPTYDCTEVRRLFNTVEKAAGQLRADLDEALEATP